MLWMHIILCTYNAVFLHLTVKNQDHLVKKQKNYELQIVLQDSIKMTLQGKS